VEYQQIAAGLFFPVFSTDALWVFWNGAGGDGLVFVFGTLLGPEATGPVVGGAWPVRVAWFPCAGFVCFWFPGCMSCACPVVLRLLWRGVVGVRGCGTGLLFENYIVDASI
jgi:hypothetical protein